MGAIVYESGGILVDHGWIRILGSGCDVFSRSLPGWNKQAVADSVKQADKDGGDQLKANSPPPFLLVADDVIGGFFAINGGAFGRERELLGKVFYFAPDTLQWESLGLGYSQFIYWCFTGDLAKSYQNYRWKGWQREVKALSLDQTLSFYPFLWTEAGVGIDGRSRKPVPILESWGLSHDR